MLPEPRITIVLLAGGSATRLPGKLSLPVDGEPMLVRVFRRLQGSGGRPLVVSSRTPLEASFRDVIRAPVVLDDYDNAGPLGGLVSAAARVATPLLFAAAGDLPNIDCAFVDRLEAEYARLGGAGETPEAIVPRWTDGTLEPLAALYDVNALASSGARALAAGRKRVTAALEGLRVAYFPVGVEHEAQLANVNTPEDYAAHRRA
jgi:molybdopterin-guanine dinucleotide biosynthesis protein A